MAKNKTIRAFNIDPFKEKIRTEYYSEEDCINEIKLWMECRVIDVIYLDDNNQLILDDEGLLKEPNRFFRWIPVDENYPAGKHQAYAGKAVIIGCNDEGNTDNSTFHPRDLEDKHVKFLEEGFVQEPSWEFVPFGSFEELMGGIVK
jgi:hypothetical protein|tara:strand:+ start:107 stop:544 length:438 start_codon:yes stop_codon:yes gene_type:complete